MLQKYIKEEEEKGGWKQGRIEEEQSTISLGVISSESGAHSEPIHTQTHNNHPNLCFRKFRGSRIVLLDYWIKAIKIDIMNWAAEEFVFNRMVLS